MPAPLNLAIMPVVNRRARAPCSLVVAGAGTGPPGRPALRPSGKIKAAISERSAFFQVQM
jgi:hypothetical protein